MPRPKNLPSDAMLDRIAVTFRVLGEPARLKLLRRLMEGEASVADLVRTTRLSQANASKHLSVLLTAQLVTRRSEGNSAYYCISDPRLTALCQLMCDGISERAEADARALRAR